MSRLKAFLSFFILLSTIVVLSGEEEKIAPIVPLDPLLTLPDLWEKHSGDLVEARDTLGFRGVSSSTTDSTIRSIRPGLQFLNLPVYEAIIRFEEDKISEITVLFFSRGDAGKELLKEDFEALLAKCTSVLTDLNKKEPKERGKDATSAVKAPGLLWESESTKYLLEWSFTREIKTRYIPFRAEFIRLQMVPTKTSGNIPLSVGITNKKGRFTGTDHVKTTPTGDVVIQDIPMVDQGQKGYCVVASAERILRYYGIEADQHELAQVANSSAKEGTNVEAMVQALKKLSARLRIKTRSLYDSDLWTILNDYNRLAKREKKEIDLNSIGYSRASWILIFKKLDIEIFRKLRMKEKADYGRFERDIIAHIDEGIPILWTALLLIPEEKLPAVFEPHMRLIIGYNKATKEILYSDSWGAGHELKRMPLEDAWMITSSLNKIEPI